MKAEIIEAALKLYNAKGRGIDYDFYIDLAIKQEFILWELGAGNED